MTHTQPPLSCQEVSEPHFTREWFALLERTALQPGCVVTRLVADTPDGDSCVLPAMRMPTTSWRLEALQTFYSPIYGPMDGMLPDRGSLTNTFQAIRSSQEAALAVLDLSPLDAESAFIEIAQQALRDAGWLVDRYFRFGNWYAPIDSPSFDEFLEARPSRVRNTLARTRKKVAKAGGTTTLFTHDDGTLDRAVADFVAVYNKSWKRPEPFPDFIPGLCKLAASKGWLRLALIHHETQPVAGQIWLVSGGRAQIVKLAHDGDWAHGSIGTLLTAELMQHVIEQDKVREIDYLIGDDAYKQDWMPLRRERHGLIAFNPRSPRGLLEAAKHFGGRLIKRLRSAGHFG